MEEKTLRLLFAKLKRNKISFSKEGQKTIIGKSKFDFVTFFGLILLPVFGGLVLVYMLLLDVNLVRNNFIKIIFGILFFLGTALFHLKKMVVRNKSNRKTKILHNHQLKIDKITLSNQNIEQIYFDIFEEKDEYEGRLFILDNKNKNHLIFQIEDTEQYLKNDLKWYVTFFKEYLKIDR
ncbi:hypothetical protein [Polaribacter porphyrae]|uniref:Uncharacterized protein n=1 Tax=Polaribacter porphyrae TaxID=1137780 RepID=A0A2S7WRJ7_9FLAO|nr:hypothetical protein [Polaribacter porphyrae]PQJ80219.1 hypothetical protein BTO18_14000 [Polaribacter porphyrae]